jgi:hypothetical protein
MWVLFRFHEKRSMRDSGFDLKNWGIDLIAGFFIGFLLVAGVVVDLTASGVYKFVSWSQNFEVLPVLAFYFFAALTEEVIFRGYIFQHSERLMGTRGAFILTCLLFGFAHMYNNVPGLSPLEQLWGCACLTLEAGILLNAAFLVRRTFWLPLGLHWAWNFFEGPFFGMVVSGTPLTTQLINARLEGAHLFTGGPFGPEASLTGLIVGTAAGIAMLRYARARGVKSNAQTPSVG